MKKAAIIIASEEFRMKNILSPRKFWKKEEYM